MIFDGLILCQIGPFNIYNNYTTTDLLHRSGGKLLHWLLCTASERICIAAWLMLAERNNWDIYNNYSVLVHISRIGVDTDPWLSEFRANKWSLGPVGTSRCAVITSIRRRLVTRHRAHACLSGKELAASSLKFSDCRSTPRSGRR